ADDFFGESAFLSLPQRPEQAMAMESAKLMAWNMPALAAIVLRHPSLGIALMQILVRRATALKERIESFTADPIGRRLARSLIRFADRQGTKQEDGAVRMPPFTHELLAQYVGTSREAVTYYMNEFRRQGSVRYSRKGITLQPDSLNLWLVPV